MLHQQGDGKYETALHFLNTHREDIRLSRTSVVLWLTEQAYTDIWALAPDFADWRTTDVHFSPPDGWVPQKTRLGKLSLREAEDLRLQIRRFENMLAQDGLDLSLRAEFENQRAVKYEQLGQEEDRQNALRASSRAIAELGDNRRFTDIYRQHVIDRFGKLTLYSVSSDAPLSIDLEQIFVKLVAVQRHQRAGESDNGDIAEPGRPRLAVRRQDHGNRDESSTPGPEPIAVSLAEVLVTHSNLAILGAPGSGKTTLLRYLALTFARQQGRQRLALDEERLPLLITLRDFNHYLDQLDRTGELPNLEPRMLPQFLSHYMNIVAPYLLLPEDFFFRQLRARHCIVLFDGLDEVADPIQRGRAAEAIAIFVRHFRGNRFVISSRPRGYEGEARQRLVDLCTDCTIQDFDDEDVWTFAANWYTAVTRERLGDNPSADAEARRQTDDLLRAIRADKRVRSLAHNPLLLSILAMVHQRGVGLPQRRAELYDECTNMLLGYWDQVKGGEAARELARYGELDRSENRTLLEPIALWFHMRGQQGIEAEKSELEQQIAQQFTEILGDDDTTAFRRAATFLKVIEERAGLIIERENGVYAFAHLTFQEYLAARALADREDYVESTLEQLHDPWWREVILLEVGHLSDVRHFGRRAQKLTTGLLKEIRGIESLRDGNLSETILKRNLLLAAWALVDIGPLGIDDNLRHDVLDEIIALWLGTPYVAQRREIGELLSYTAPTVSGRYLADKFQSLLGDSNKRMRRHAARAIRHLGPRAANDKTLTTLLNTLRDPDVGVRQAVVQAIGRLDAGSPRVETLAALTGVLNDSSRRVRRAAIYAIGELGSRVSNDKTILVLLDALNDPDIKVRQAAVHTIGQLGAWTATGNTVAALLNVLNDPELEVRWTAIRTVGRLDPRVDGNKAVTALLNAVRDPSPDIRRAALDAVSGLRHWLSSDNAVSALLNALIDPEAGVRQAAASAIGDLGPQVSSDNTLSALLNALNDPEAGVRQAAASAIGNLGRRVSSDNTLRALLDALRDPEMGVRLAVLMGIFRLEEQLGMDNIHVALSAMKDPEPEVRIEAVDAITMLGVRAASDVTLPALLAALNDPAPGVRMITIRAISELAAYGAHAVNDRTLISLVDAFNDPEPNVRIYALIAVFNLYEQFGSENAREALLVGLNSREPGMRRVAANIVGELGALFLEEYMGPTLLSFLKDPEPSVRLAATRSFNRLDISSASDELIEALRAALNDPKPSVRWAAAQAIQK